MITWKTLFCKYNFRGNQALVTTLDYDTTYVQGDFETNIKGCVDVSGQKRVYPLPALLNVPEHVMTQWVKEALGPEQVEYIENQLQIRFDESENPTSGGFPPKE